MGRKGKQKSVYLQTQFWNTPEPNCYLLSAYSITDRELLRHPKYLQLSEHAKGIYLLMRCSCGSKEIKWFSLPESEANKFGYSASTFRRAVKQLKELGFIEQNIEVTNGDRAQYRFSGKWRSTGIINLTGPK